jgi:hypothetical protein
MTTVAFTILGEPASKANSRELAVIGPKHARRTILRKGDKALDYERDERWPTRRIGYGTNPPGRELDAAWRGGKAA